MLTNTTPQPSLFPKKHALAIRIWHWVTFSLFTATIVMVLLANTLFDTKPNIAMVQDQVKEKGGMVTTEQARNVAHEYRDKLWNTHRIIGYFLAFALLSRVVTEIAISKEEKIASRIKIAAGVTKVNRGIGSDARHYLTVKYSYLIFYGLFFMMACTGLILSFEDVEFLKPIHNIARSIHSFGQYTIYGYIVFHVIGVVRADVTEYPGIISRMVNKGNA